MTDKQFIKELKSYDSDALYLALCESRGIDPSNVTHEVYEQFINAFTLLVFLGIKLKKARR